MELDSNTSMPLYKQLELMLREEIDNGKRPAGSQLPTENELEQIYHVSRVTVRKALSMLVEDGYLERRSGKGTFVTGKKFQRNIDRVIGFTEMCQKLGKTAGAKTLKIALEDPTEKECQQLSIESDCKILCVERLRTANGKPVILEYNKFPEAFSFLFGENLNNASLYDALKKYNIIFTQSKKMIDIVFATTNEAKLLGITKGYLLLRISSVVTTADSSFTALSKQLCIGDQFKLMV